MADKFPGVVEFTESYCKKLPLSEEGKRVCENTRYQMYNKAREAASSCDIDALAGIMQELGALNAEDKDFIKPWSQIYEGAVSPLAQDMILGAQSNYNGAVVQAVMEALKESCGCRLK